MSSQAISLGLGRFWSFVAGMASFMLPAERLHAQPGRLLSATARRLAYLSFVGAAGGALAWAVDQGDPKLYLYFLSRDAPVLLLLGLLFLVAARAATNTSALPAPIRLDRAGRTGLALLTAITVGIAVYALSRLTYQNFVLSVDEFMVEFDAKIMAGGRLLASISTEWRDYVPALQPIFRLNVPDNAYWTSSYLPMNAALRSVFVLLGAPALHGAVLAGVAISALFGVARRLWPHRPDAAVVSVVLLASSSQFLVTAMMPYAMTAHLALNMVWLWLFLRDTRPSHALAAVVGFVACGLHQVIFHPLFVAPFLLSLLAARRWKLLTFYGAAYGAIGLFWILYWSLVLQAINAPIGQSADVGLGWFIQRIVDMIDLNPGNIALIGMHLVRFMAWQSPLAIPLAVVGFLAWRNRLSIELALGIALTLLVMLLLMPEQGHGWGYRYLHGFLGSVCLLAAQGWICLTNRTGDATRQPAVAVLASVTIALFVMLPWHLYQMRAAVTPYASASAAISGSGADVVVIDPTNIWFGNDLVRNDPFLEAAPKVLTLTLLNETRVTELCRRYDVAVFDRSDAERLGIRWMYTPPDFAEHHQKMRDLMKSLGCGRPVDAGR